MFNSLIPDDSEEKKKTSSKNETKSRLVTVVLADDKKYKMSEILESGWIIQGSTMADLVDAILKNPVDPNVTDALVKAWRTFSILEDDGHPEPFLGAVFTGNYDTDTIEADVTRSNFRQYLPDYLRQVASSHPELIDVFAGMSLDSEIEFDDERQLDIYDTFKKGMIQNGSFVAHLISSIKDPGKSGPILLSRAIAILMKMPDLSNNVFIMRALLIPPSGVLDTSGNEEMDEYISTRKMAKVMEQFLLRATSRNKEAADVFGSIKQYLS